MTLPARSPSTPSLDTTLSARLAASAEHWKRKLLDLSKRNRAVHFRVNKVSTIAIVDEQPAEVFRQLYLREKSLRFKPAPEPDSVAEPSGGKHSTHDLGTGASEDEEDEFPDQLHFALYNPSSLDERHSDNWLQTSSTAESLDRSLRRLDEQARLSIEEQGVNTLFLALGMLHYKESDDSDEISRAPLVLLPAELSRKSARSGYVLRASDEDPLVNPALAEYLRRDYGLALPPLPNSSAIPDDYDLQSLLMAVGELVAGHAAWAVKTEIYLALFSFQKFVMYKDLEANSEPLRTHRLIGQLVSREGEHIKGLPEEVHRMDLDQEFAPEATHQVVDADSSQLRAIAAVARDYDLVLEGPPGTGKSQTITNLIAEALALGKSVLFVAEKMAALSVVHDRLVRAGLGEFCLELHSTKANKRAVMKEVGASLDASLNDIAAPTVSTQRLPHVRRELTEYARALHTPHGSMAVSPFRAYGELSRVLAATRVAYPGRVDGDVTKDLLAQTVRDLQDLALAASALGGSPATHPWRDAEKTYYTEDDLESVHALAGELASRAADVLVQADAVCAAFGLPPIRSTADVRTAVDIAQVFARSPGAPLGVLQSELWNVPPPDATGMIERGRSLQDLKSHVADRFTPKVLEQEHAADIAYVEKKARGIFSFLAPLDSRWRAIRKRWGSYRLAGYQASLVEQATEMAGVDRLLAERKTLAGLASQGTELFGGLWRGEDSDWGLLEGYVHWVVEFRAVCVRHGLAGRAIETAACTAPDISEVEALAAKTTETFETMARLRVVVGWPADHLSTAPLQEILERSRSLRDAAELGPRWAAFEAARQRASQSLAAELLPLGMRDELPFAELACAFLRAFWMKWLSGVVQARPALQRFHALTHEERVAEFRRLDETVLLENRAALVGRLRNQAQQRLREPAAVEQMPYLRREMVRQRGLNPLRRTMREAAVPIRAIKPCFMMSPLTVAQLLDGSTPTFDLVIFDEASQLPPEDAVGAIIRGRQLVVVGDPKQLPPTNFFAVSLGASPAEVADDLVEDAESVLEQFMAAGIPVSRLKWHYRSAHESLIRFSNVQFYDADLYTFPSVETGSETYGLQFEYVPDGLYEGKGLNAVEVRRLADEVVRFAKEQLYRRSRGEPAQSLGVGTFNLRQQLAIQDELERRRRNEPSIDPFFERGVDEPFFVKNLENIQGDERDVIFISVTYGRSLDGKIRYNFGPLNGENGWRRLNVLVTRARQRMRVFSSIRGEEISSAATTSRGAHLLREFLHFAERGRLESVSANLAAEAESPFEKEVIAALVNRGITVVPQVGVAGYRIDIGVLDDVVPGRYVCGIECDGVAYHRSETARDRDRLRQQVLEARGWIIHRAWSTDWFKDRQGQLDRLVRLIEESRARIRETVKAEREARELAADAESKRRAGQGEGVMQEAARLRDGGASDAPYRRPMADAYAFAPGDGVHAGSDLLIAPFSQLVHAAVVAVEAESPIHEAELLARVAARWSTRLGSRVQARIREAIEGAAREHLVERRGAFYWSPASQCRLRSRAGTGIPAERIAPEEYREAVLAVLAQGHGFSRDQLTAEARAVLGYGRTSQALERGVSMALVALIRDGRVGEGSVGVRLRQGPPAPGDQVHEPDGVQPERSTDL